MNTKAFKQGAELTGWLRAPAAERFLKDLGTQHLEASAVLMGACSVSSDPAVRAAYSQWKTLFDLTQFLQNSRKESSTEEDE